MDLVGPSVGGDPDADAARAGWIARRTFVGADVDPERLAADLARQGGSVSVVLPALDVEATVGEIVDALRAEYLERVPLAAEIVVMNGHSSDATARRAAEAGARVVQEDEVLHWVGSGRGKGEAMWKSLACTTGDIVVWLDADTHRFDPAFLPGLVAPLVADAGIEFVKGFYHRPLGSSSLGGGRVTEICARPLLNLFFPPIAALAQPLAGEQAGRRRTLEAVPFFTGYGVETGLLIDIASRCGMDAIAQVDLGERVQDHQSTVALGRMAYAILQVVMRRLAESGRAPDALALAGPYIQPVLTDAGLEASETAVEVAERPPMVDARLLAP